MLLAFCTLRQDYRRFHLDRMEEVRLSEESFRPRRVALLRDYLAAVAPGLNGGPARPGG